MESEEIRWFALRAFWNKTQALMSEARAAGWQTYYAIKTQDSLGSGSLEYKDIPLVPALFFVRCPLQWLQDFKQKHYSQLYIYTDVPGGKPAPIRDAEMDMFILVTSRQNNSNDVEYLGEPRPKYVQGDLVRVTEGLYKGAQGHVVRIRKDRKLVVAITGVAVVAISHIPMCYLEKVEN
jgi:hypothetical protein